MIIQGSSVIFSSQSRAYDDAVAEKFCIGEGKGEQEEDTSLAMS